MSRSKQSINQNWRFFLGDIAEAKSADYDDGTWETVHVPHTLRLTSLTLDGCTDDNRQKTFHRHIAWYRRTIDVSEQKDGSVFIEFEGAHQVTELWVNGLYAGKHGIGGYTPFHFDITDLVHRGSPNILALRLDNTVNPEVPPDDGPFDYVHFGGLYRSVYIVEADQLHVTFPWEDIYAGVYVATPTVKSDSATISVRTTIRNGRPFTAHCLLKTRVVDGQGLVVLRMKRETEIAAGAKETVLQTGGIDEDLHLWSIDTPYLYRVVTTIHEGNTIVDQVENPLGIRTFELREGVGFLLNGVPTKLIGPNRHQAYPYIGDAVPKSLHRKDAIQFKEAGFNVIRLAHYPHDNAFVEACDELGMLVYEEAPTWIDIGNEVWLENLEQALRVAIRNHRNHPSVFMWGGGINHRGTVEALHYAAKQEDPTRWTGSNHAPWTGAQQSGVCDVYTNMDYRDIPETDEFMFAIEHGGSEDGERNQLLISSYKASWRRFGMAVWTGHSHNTFQEHTGGTSHLTAFGVMTAFRQPRPVFHWYRSELTSKPMIYIADRWQEGTETLRVFSNCEEVALLINGKEIERRRPDSNPDKANLNSPPFTFAVRYTDGKVEARGLIDEKPAATCSVRTPVASAAIRLIAGSAKCAFAADGSDIVMLYAEVVDENGTVVYDSEAEVTFAVEGPGSIVGDAEIGANPIRAIDGVAPAMLRAGTEPGVIVVSAVASGLTPDSIEVTSSPYVDEGKSGTGRPIYDYDRLRVDLGGTGQMLQFGWTRWDGSSAKEERIGFSEFKGCSATIRPRLPEHALRWLGQNNISGPLGYVAEDGVWVDGATGLDLVFENLPVGRYRLRTYHHCPGSDTDPMDPLRKKMESRGDGGTSVADSVRLTLENPDTKNIDTTVSARQTNGRKIGPSGPGMACLEFVTSGEGEITITIEASDSDGAVWLNGFCLDRLPPLTGSEEE